MDFQLHQWRDQHETRQEHNALKVPKSFESHHEQQQSPPLSESALPLFVHGPASKISKLSAAPDFATATPRFSRMGSYFSLAQWQELELQALIYRYLLIGASVPPELFQSIKKSLLHAPHYFPHSHLQHYQPALLQSGYWGRGAMDPEPGRCRRTDGKKWRCSRDVVVGQKYCERHMHRGKNRSRKPVDIKTSTKQDGGCLKQPNKSTNAQPFSTLSGCSHFDFSGPSSSIDVLHLTHSSAEAKEENKGIFISQNEVDSRSGGGHILRPFLDDWPRSLRESDNVGSNGCRTATSLSISMPNNSSSDVSLKLATGNGYELGAQDHKSNDEIKQDHGQLNWAASMGGGPLGEALRSSTSSISPTSVLHQLQRDSASDVSYVST